MLGRSSDSNHPIQVALQSVHHRQAIETTKSTIACVFVSEGMGVAIVDPFSASEFVGRNVILRPFEPSIKIGTGSSIRETVRSR